jgi:hypothetical protein
MPSDISAFLSSKTIKTLVGPSVSVGQSMTGIKLKGGISGGTLATAIASVEEVPLKKIIESRTPYVLSPGRFEHIGFMKMFLILLDS